MKLMLTIAWRNILRHRGKSLVIGVILFLGALLMTVGNGVIAGMNEGIKKHIVEGFMGDIVLISEKQKSDNILLDMMGTTIEPVSTYKEIKEALGAQDYVEKFLPVGKNLVLVLSENESYPGYIYILGVDYEKYKGMFPGNSRPLEGRFLNPGEKGLIVPTFARDELYNYSSTWLIPEGGSLIKENMKKEQRENIENIFISSNIVLMGMSGGANSTTDIRLGIKGIAKYEALNTIFGHFCITDIESYRECFGYFSTSETELDIPKEEQKLLGMDSSGLDALFGSDSLIVSDTHARTIQTQKKPAVKAQSTQEDIEDGIYNAVFVRLKEGVTYKTAINKLNSALSDAKTGVKAITWNRAAGPVGSMALIIKSALFVFVTILFFVAVIIIINTLTMAALERTPEIGMMRAVGARKSFIGGMFLGETGILSGIFGGAGIIAGIIAVNVIPLLKITSDNDMVQLLYGGDVFNPILSAGDIGITIFQLLIVTIVAALYPIGVAKSITPLDAISRD